MESAGGNAGTRLGGGIARENLEGGLVTMCVQRRHSEIEMVGDGRVGIGLGFARYEDALTWTESQSIRLLFPATLFAGLFCKAWII